MTSSEQILFELESRIFKHEPNIPTLVPGDKYLHSSALQKSIRRGEKERAGQAAVSLWYQDRHSFWRRLHVIALEDIGIGDTNAVIKTLTVVSSPLWRKKAGDLQTGLHLTRLLCEAVKSRLADAVFIVAEKATAYADLRERMVRANDQTLIDYVIDDNKPVSERCLAVWLLAGTKQYPSDMMPPRAGSLDSAISAIRALNTPIDLTEACVAVTSRTQWPLALFTPLLWQEAHKHILHVRYHDIPPTPDVEGLPVISADMFTRTGKACIRRLRNAVPALQSFSPKQIELAVFYAEGGRVDRELTAPALERIQQAGEVTDMESSGITMPEYQSLRQCLLENMDKLTAIRQDQLQRYLEGGI